MKCIDQLRADLEAVGASLDVDDYTLNLDATPGYTWNASGASCICIPYASNSQQWATQAVRQARHEAGQGMTKCTPEESADIEHARAEDWTAPADADDIIPFPK